MLWVFACLLALNALGLTYGLILHRGESVDSSIVAFFWSWYNILVLIFLSASFASNNRNGAIPIGL